MTTRSPGAGAHGRRARLCSRASARRCRMQFGLFSLIPRRDLGQTPTQLFADAFELSGLADQSEAFDTAWIAEHHFSNYGLVPAPLPYAVKLAERTRRLKLVTAVLVLPFYQ